MNILHINRNYLDTTLHQIMSEKLREHNIDNTVFVPVYDKKLALINPNENVYVSECFNKIDRFIFELKQWKILKALDKSICINKFDCIHAFTLFTDGNCAMKLSKKYSIPYVVAIRNTDVNTFFEKMPFLRRRGIEIMENASEIFFLSETYRKMVFDKYVPANKQQKLMSKVRIIPNGIDDYWFDNLVTIKMDADIKRLNNKEVRLIYAGRIDRNKNIPTTLKAIEILQNQGYKIVFTIVGKVMDESVYKEIKSKSYTKYIDSQPKEKLIEIYRNNDIFVMPSFTESFGLVYVEAMSQGLPVIYTKGQGFDGQFEEGQVGFHVDSSRPGEIAETVKRIIDNYSIISDNCILSSEKFCWDKIIHVYEKKYNEVIATRSELCINN